MYIRLSFVLFYSSSSVLVNGFYLNLQILVLSFFFLILFPISLGVGGVNVRLCSAYLPASLNRNSHCRQNSTRFSSLQNPISLSQPLPCPHATLSQVMPCPQPILPTWLYTDNTTLTQTLFLPLESRGMGKGKIILSKH